MVTLVKAKKDKTIKTTRWIYEFVWYRVPDRRARNRKSPTATGAESTARNDELVSVGGAQTKTRSDFGGWKETISEVTRCLIAQTTVHHTPSLYEMHN